MLYNHNLQFPLLQIGHGAFRMNRKRSMVENHDHITTYTPTHIKLVGTHRHHHQSEAHLSMHMNTTCFIAWIHMSAA